MPQDNPYTPPRAATEPPPPPSATPRPRDPNVGTPAISSRGLETVEGLAKWMRIVSVSFLVLSVLFLGVAAFIATSNHHRGALNMSAFNATRAIVTTSLYGLFTILSALWLWRGTRHLVAGIRDGDAISLSRGFANLQPYLIVYATLQLIGLAITLGEIVKKSL